MTKHYLAQLNTAQMLAPLDDPIMAGFMNKLDEINALAEASDGFVWRLQTDDGNATALRIFGDDTVLVNISVWENVESLFDYTYKTAHTAVMRDRHQWFTKMEQAYMCMWWTPAPSVTTDEAKQKLTHLRKNGVTPLSFTFKQRYTVEEFLAYQSS